MKSLFFIFVISILTFRMYPQNTGICTLSSSIDTVTNADPNIAKVFECWSGYLSSSPDSLYNNSFWNDLDKKRYVSYDLLKSEDWLSPGLYAFRLNNLVISITNMGDRYLRSIFYWINDRQEPEIMAITNPSTSMKRKERTG
jgi:hypothetical protein